MRRIYGQDDLDYPMQHLQANDPALTRAVSAGAWPELRLRPPGFEALLQIIISQQLSTASADAIWARLRTAIDPTTPAELLRTDEAVLRQAGLGRAKTRYARALARAVHEAHVDLHAVQTMDADEAVTHLTQIDGIGPWTAQIYLLFCAGHPDVFPAGDLALREATRVLYDLAERPDMSELQRIARRWRPWRGVAARLLWNYYRVVKGAKA